MKTIFALLIIGATQAFANSFLIGGLGVNPTGPFRYSLIHAGTGPGAMSGDVLGWLQLDDTWTGSSLDAIGVANDGKAFYREADGRIEFRAHIYDQFDDPAFSVPPIGQVVVKGSGFVPASLDNIARTKDIMGELVWDFDLDSGNDLVSWLIATETTRTLSYVDRNYGALTINGAVANGKTASEIALWGARGLAAQVNVAGDHLTNATWQVAHPGTGNQIGTDLVLELAGDPLNCVTPDCMPTPEAGTFVLLATGLVGVAVYHRRK